MTLPNLLTLLRIVLVPIFIWLWLGHHLLGALAVFFVAAMTDLVDGYLARALHQESRLGTLLDPTADKLMLVSSYLLAGWLRAVPWWLVGIVIGRDLLLALGAGVIALVLRRRHQRPDWGPSRIGKYTTFFQLMTIGAVLLMRVTSWALAPWLSALVVMTAILTVVSAAQYLLRGVAWLVRPEASQRIA